MSSWLTSFFSRSTKPDVIIVENAIDTTLDDKPINKEESSPTITQQPTEDVKQLVSSEENKQTDCTNLDIKEKVEPLEQPNKLEQPENVTRTDDNRIAPLRASFSSSSSSSTSLSSEDTVSVNSLESFDIDWSKFHSRVSLLYNCFPIPCLLKGSFLMGFLGHLKSTVPQFSKIDVKMIYSDCFSIDGDIDLIPNAKEGAILENLEKNILVSCQNEKIVIKVNESSDNTDSWATALKCICNTILDQPVEENQDLFIIIIETDSDSDIENEIAICYEQKIWIIQCKDIDTVLESHKGLLYLKQSIPSLTLICMGSWIPNHNAFNTPDLVFVFGSDDYQPGLNCWTSFFSECCSFSDFCILCSKADWEEELVCCESKLGKYYICNIPNVLRLFDSCSSSESTHSGVVENEREMISDIKKSNTKVIDSTLQDSGTSSESDWEFEDSIS